jgi:predicted nucleic acid-binding protein
MTAEPVFVDTDVLLYEWDARAEDKQRLAARWLAELWHTRRGRLSYQVLAEYYVTATRKLKPGLSAAAAQRNVRHYLAWHPVVTDSRLIEAAWDAQGEFRLSWWDALIVAAAKAARCRYLLTEDLQHGQDLDGLLVLDPFKTVPGEARLRR